MFKSIVVGAALGMGVVGIANAEYFEQENKFCVAASDLSEVIAQSRDAGIPARTSATAILEAMDNPPEWIVRYFMGLVIQTYQEPYLGPVEEGDLTYLNCMEALTEVWW